MDILYISHCVPNPPDKGERIRAYHFVRALAREYRVHIAAFARSDEEAAGAKGLEQWCESVHVERLNPGLALARAAVRFGAGKSLTVSYFDSGRMRDYLARLCDRVRFDGTVAFTTVMASYAPAGVPLLLDMADVDSEKWLQYGRMRIGGPLYSMEGRRLRRHEIIAAERAQRTFLATEAERALLGSFCQNARTAAIENGVDFEYFDPKVTPLPELTGRKYLVFVGVMDYYPNVDGVCWFVSEIFPCLRQANPDLEFLIVGRNPAQRVRRLDEQGGVTVVGGVPDVRPYVLGAEAVVAPLRLARGIQNKVLEALAMGKRVLASPEVCATFGSAVPAGVENCRTANEYERALGNLNIGPPIRAGAAQRFQWKDQIGRMMAVMPRARVTV